MIFDKTNVAVGDHLTADVGELLTFVVVGIDDRWVRAQQTFADKKIKQRGWRRVAYNKIKRNLSTEFRGRIDELVNI